MKKIFTALLVLVATQTSVFARCGAALCSGDLVLKGNTIRTVEFFAGNGQVVLAEDRKYYRTFTNMSYISKIVQCQGKFCTGDKVLKGDTIRTIEYLDNTNRVVLAEDSKYYRTFTSAAYISKVVECFGQYCMGDTVLKGNAIREIELLDDTGRVVLKEDNKYYRSFTRTQYISMIRKCFRHNHRTVAPYSPARPVRVVPAVPARRVAPAPVRRPRSGRVIRRAH